MKKGEIIKSERAKAGMTLQELGRILGVSKQTVQRYESGEISNIPSDKIEKMAEVFNVPPSHLLGWDDLYKYISNMDIHAAVKRSNLMSKIRLNSIPLLGTIAAGQPILAIENIEDYHYVGSNIKADFAITVKGDSMVNASIQSGDIAYIRKQDNLENGEIGAVLVDGEATLKRFYKEDGVVTLVSENPKYRPMVYTNGDMKILGKLVALLKQMEG